MFVMIIPINLTIKYLVVKFILKKNFIKKIYKKYLTLNFGIIKLDVRYLTTIKYYENRTIYLYRNYSQNN